MSNAVPSHLGAPSSRWATEVLDVVGDDATETEIKLVILAAEALDRASSARRLIQREGITYTDRFGAPRQHPAVSIERDARAAFARIVAQLGLDSTDDTAAPYVGANGHKYTGVKSR